ncbi:hypothetical protein [Streptomyces sp. NPDC002573]|uniref:hypothetical protein n=1 Tax=Streptomyces sp. NPDC002573 TaxID=3364651 RepID=UPI0036CBE7C4
MDTTRRAQLVMNVLQHAVAGDYDRTMQTMGKIAEATDRRQMYGVCRAFAEAGRQTLIHLYGHPSPEGLWAMVAPDPDDGCAQHPAHTFSLRFITAYANGDMPTCQALYLAAANASPENYGHSLTALIGDVAYLVRAAAQEPAADGEQPAQHPH